MRLERFSRRLAVQVLPARKGAEEGQSPAVRLHDLRYTPAALLLADGVPVEIVCGHPACLCAAG